jgi:SAM-dependent methyltransferase
VNNVVYGSPSLTDNADGNAEIIHKRMLSIVLARRPSSLLEVGAGQGKLGANCVKHGIRYVGIEPVDSEIEVARRNFPGLKIIQASCYDDPVDLQLGKFDVVYSNDVIEHLYEPRKLVEFSKAHLKVGGIIICGTPHYGSYLRNLLLSLSNRWDHHHAPLWDGGHIKFFSKSTLRAIWADAGFSEFEWGEIGSSRLRIVPMYLYCVARLFE